jgi:protein-disulfide isomerase
MADETTPAETPVAAKPAAKRSVHKRKKKVTKITKTASAPARTAPVSNSALIAVYVILGLLVIGTSFAVGYLVGKGNSGTTQTGSEMTGKLQIIEYSDYQCPFCSRVEPTIAQLRQEYGDKIEVVYKNYPLESIHPDALNAAIAAECARNQGEDEFWAYHDKLFANQNALDGASLKQYAQAQGLNVNDFNKCFDGKETESRIRAEMQEASGRGVQGTPSFWIKDELVVGALPYDMFKSKIDEKLSGKAAPAPAPTPAPAPQPSAPVDVATGAHVLGNADAPVTIVEFSDFQCPFCQRFYNDAEKQIITNYVNTGKAKLAFRHFPLPFHQNAQKAGEAAECAAKQGKFWEMHDVMFQKGSGDGTGLDVASLKQYAADLKLDTAKFNSCLDSGETASIVQQDTAAGSAAGVSGTPTVFVNGKAVVGAQPYANFQQAIDAELQ